MIDGLKLTMTGDKLRTLIEERVVEHHLQAAHWTEEAARTRDDETVDRPLLPEHICENEAARSEWRMNRLRFICDHLDPNEVYLLGEMDLEFADLLEEEPEMHGPDYTEEPEPWARRICDSPEIIEIRNPDHQANAERTPGA